LSAAVLLDRSRPENSFLIPNVNKLVNKAKASEQNTGEKSSFKFIFLWNFKTVSFKVNREFENYGVRMFKAVDLGTVMSNASGLIFLVGKFLIAC